jgi:hypothetical protein
MDLMDSWQQLLDHARGPAGAQTEVGAYRCECARSGICALEGDYGRERVRAYQIACARCITRTHDTARA